MIVVRVDGGGSLGMGHVARCSAVAREAAALGEEVLFVVSDAVSQDAANASGFSSKVIGGDRGALGARDGEELGRFARSLGSTFVLVDSYAVSEAFFDAYRGAAGGVSVGYIDDLYCFAEGRFEVPRRLDVDLVVNYMFGVAETDYRRVYSGNTELLVGPSFAPIGSRFRNSARATSSRVGRILVTTGSTNPGCALERFTCACREAMPEAALDVVVGEAADFDTRIAGGEERLSVHRGVNDLAPLMSRADIAVSAAGSTLYELACAGVPAVAVPIVENQARNAVGFSSAGCGSAVGLNWSIAELAKAVALVNDREGLRDRMSRRGRLLVDGRGAKRIAGRLLLSQSVGDKTYRRRNG